MPVFACPDYHVSRDRGLHSQCPGSPGSMPEHCELRLHYYCRRYTLLMQGFKRMNPFCIPFAITNMPGAILAMDLGFMGPNYSISTACATGNYCILRWAGRRASCCCINQAAMCLWNGRAVCAMQTVGLISLLQQHSGCLTCVSPTV